MSECDDYGEPEPEISWLRQQLSQIRIKLMLRSIIRRTIPLLLKQAQAEQWVVSAPGFIPKQLTVTTPHVTCSWDLCLVANPGMSRILGPGYELMLRAADQSIIELKFIGGPTLGGSKQELTPLSLANTVAHKVANLTELQPSLQRLETFITAQGFRCEILGDTIKVYDREEGNSPGGYSHIFVSQRGITVKEWMPNDQAVSELDQLRRSLDGLTLPELHKLCQLKKLVLRTTAEPEVLTTTLDLV